VRTIQRFERSDSVRNRPKSGRLATVTNENKIGCFMVFCRRPPYFYKSRYTTTRNWSCIHSQDFEKKNKWHSYKLHLFQELSEDDFDRFVQFCDLIMEMLNNDPLFLDDIVFSDEATFELTGNINRHNCRYWSDINSYWMRENHSIHKKLMCGVVFSGVDQSVLSS